MSGFGAFPLALLALLVVVSPALSGPGSADRSQRQSKRSEPPRNRYGLPVVDPEGHRLSYSREETEAPKAGAAERAPREALASAAAEPDAPAFSATQVWAYAAYGSSIGLSNIVVAANGPKQEIYVGGSTTTFGPDDYWQALRFDPGTQGYNQVYVSPYFGSGFAGIARIEVGEVDPSPGSEILVALADGRIEVYALASKSWLREIVTGVDDLRGLAVANVDGDPASEIALCDSSDLYVYSATGGLEWHLAGAGGQDLVVGQMDSDPAREIALTGGSVVDAGTHAAQWTWPSGFGADVEAADIDGDGLQELVVAEAWDFVRAYDVETKLSKWSIPADHDIGAIHLADIDGDGIVELLLGDGQWGSIHAYDTVTLAQEWEIANPEHGVTDIATADVDGDGDVELLWGAGATSTGPDHVYVVDWSTGETEWTNVDLVGPFIGPERADLDGDGKREIVVASEMSDSGYGSGRILVFDGTTLKLRAMSAPIVGNLAWTGLHDLRLRDVDGNGDAEILVAADRLYDGVIEIYDFDASNAFTLKWTNATRPEGAPFYSAEAADIDGDGALEIVAGGGREHTGADGVFVYAYEYATAGEEWHSAQVGGFWDAITGLRIGDADLDGAKEILGLVREGDLYIFDGPSKTLEAILPNEGTALQLYGAAGAAPRIMVGDANGDLATFKYQGSYQQTSQRHYVPGPVDGFDRVEGGGFWLGEGGRLRLATNAGAPQWQSDSYGTLFGMRTLALNPRRFLAAGSYSVVGFLASNAATESGLGGPQPSTP